MKRNTTSGTYKTISYTLIHGKKQLIIIFPRAGAVFASHRTLVYGLHTFGSVLFIQSGYFGISKAGKQKEHMTMDAFRTNLHDLVKTLGYKKIILIGESVGGMHALHYASCYVDDVTMVMLSNPALYKPRWIYTHFLVPLLSFGLKTSPDKVLTGVGKLLKLIPKKSSKELGGAFIAMSQTVGAISYLSCIREIVDFKNIYETAPVADVLQKTTVLNGQQDKIFDFLCNRDYCKKSVHYKEILSAGHHVIDIHVHEVIRTLNHGIACFL